MTAAGRDGLPAGANRRLEAFAAAFERIDAGGYGAFAIEPDDRARMERAVAAAAAAVGGAAAGSAAALAIDRFVDWAAAAYSGRLTATDTFLLFQSLPDRADDRARFVAALRRAVLGLIAWDAVAPGELIRLLGAFVDLVEDACGPLPEVIADPGPAAPA